ncbi:MAG: hypothetical protein COS99_06655 [Candidatus Omnitrophica bacterium CG07_land_8_20_14_0_80_42_15]|uniref:Type II secretion system protein GspC N-terminal domain-containing protein n=1 Tax=Candidatus Aquitaenariimonas noxiae TaxID=1974741 RepID=A0A2J0KTU9_9BACT|nr:MAG: hypothetical protein COS99_06655 [Candidatus Omnitrophica bacterium CG07_land_8_20_14_0_80_42_15]
MKLHITPEEKLLQLIKKKRVFNDKVIKKESKPGVKDLFASFNIAKVKEALTANLSKIFVFLLIGIIVYFVVDSALLTPFYRHKIVAGDSGVIETDKTTDEKNAAAEVKQEESTAKQMIAETAKPYSYYSKDMENRDIFRPLVQEEQRAVGDNLKDVKENLSLIGIIEGDKLQAAIEDKKGNKTHFVYKGDSLNDVSVEDILENKVILNYKGEKFELTM